MVKIRLKRFGKKHRPFYRICVADSRKARDGKTIEDIGTYNPFEEDEQKKYTLKVDRAEYWLSVGAQPTKAVKDILKKMDVGLGLRKKK